MQHEIIEGAGAKNEHPIATSAMELLASIIQVLGRNPSYLQQYQIIWDKVTTYINVSNKASDLISCLVLAEELLEVYSEDARFVVSALIPAFPHTSVSRHEYCRANTYYLISLLFDIFPREMEQDLQNYTQILRDGLVHRPGDVGIVLIH